MSISRPALVISVVFSIGLIWLSVSATFFLLDWVGSASKSPQNSVLLLGWIGPLIAAAGMYWQRRKK